MKKPFRGIARFLSLGKFISWFSEKLGIQSDREQSAPATIDPEAIIQKIEAVLAVTPRHKPNRGCLLKDLSNRLYHRYRKSGRLDDLLAAITHLEAALEMTVLSDALRGDLFGDLSDQFNEKFRLLEHIDDLGKAIESMTASVLTTPADHPRLVERSEKLSVHFNTRYELLGGLDDLEASIRHIRGALEAVVSTPINNTNRIIMLTNLSNSLHDRYQRLGSLEDLEAGIRHLEAAVLASPEVDPYRPIMLYNLSAFVLSRYQHVPDLRDLEAAIGYLNSSLAAIPGDHELRLVLLDRISSALETRYGRLGDSKNLDLAIEHIQEAIAGTPAADHRGRGDRLNELSTILFTRYQELGATADLEAAIEHINHAIREFRSSGDLSDLPKLLTNLAIFFLARFKLLADAGDLDDSIKQSRAAIDCMGDIGPNHPDQPGVLANLSTALISRYALTNDVSDLNAAIENTETVLATTAESHKDRPSVLNNLGSFLRTRYERFHDVCDLDSAIKNTTEAFVLTPVERGIERGGGGKAASYRARARYVLALCWLLRTRAERPNPSDNLDSAINYAKSMLEEVPPHHPDRPDLLQSLSICLSLRYNRDKSPSDLDMAASHINEALTSIPNTHPERPSGLNQFSAIIVARYIRTGALVDLRDAIKYVEDALDTMPINDTSRGRTLTNLSRLLHFQHRRLGAAADLNTALEYAESVLRSTPMDHPDYISRLSHVSEILHARFDRLGNSDDLESAIHVMQDCLKGTPIGHADRTGNLIDLGSLLRCKFRRFGASADLDAAAEYAKAAVEETPIDDPDYGRITRNLRSIVPRDKKLRNSPDIDAAIQHHEAILATTSPTHRSRPTVLWELGNCFLSRFSASEALCDIDVAIGHFQSALAVTPEDHPSRGVILDSLGNCFHIRYEHLNDISDLDMSIDYEQASILATPVDHPTRAHILTCLGTNLRLRYSRLNSETDRARSLESFLEAWNSQTAPPLVRVQAVWRATKFFPSCQTWEKSSLLLEDAIKLLPKISLRSLGRDDQQRVLSSLYGLSSLAASFALQAERGAYEALKLLELGRGIITGFALDNRSEMSELQETHPALSESLNVLRAEANAKLPENLGDQAQLRDSSSNRRRALDQIDAVLAEIRGIPAYKDFLLLPCETDLMRMAENGAIAVMITTSLRSDAIIITASSIRSIKLPKMVYKTAKRKMREMSGNFHGRPQTLGPRNKAMKKLLSWLWDVAVEPVLKELDSKSSRIWWIGTGELSRAPFHAAGHHTKGSSNYTMSRVVSSYIPTVKALSYTRQQSFNLVSKRDARLLLVTMPTTPLHASLSGVEKEVDAIVAIVEGKLAEPVLDHSPEAPEEKKARTAVLKQPNALTVLEQLGQFEAVHFACHGVSDGADPSNSSLLLLNKSHDTVDRLTVRNISRASFGNAQLAYLSACSTADNPSIELSDEIIHLASAFQLAGFNHVLATLWQSKDEACKTVAEVFYTSLFDGNDGHGDSADPHSKVSSALHEAVKKVREGNLDRPLMWAPFIHTGA